MTQRWFLQTRYTLRRKYSEYKGKIALKFNGVGNGKLMNCGPKLINDGPQKVKKIFFFLLRYNISLNFLALKPARKASFLVTMSQNLVTFRSKTAGILLSVRTKTIGGIESRF